MWIVRLALRRPYTFVAMSLLIALLGGTAIVTMPVDIFPYIDIPVISVIWNYSGISPDELEKRILTFFERAMTTTVNDIEHIESQAYSGVSVTRVYFQPNAKVELALAQITAISNTLLRALPPGITPPSIIKYDASSVPIIHLPLRVVNGATVYLRDVAQVRDGYSVQTSIVRTNGTRGALLTVMRSGKASTLAVVNAVKAAMPKILAGLPPALKVRQLFDQRPFVPAALHGVA